MIKHSGGGGGGGLGPVATEDVTFKIVEAFERQDGEGRAVIDVSHIHGSEGFGCDLISVASEAVKQKALAAGEIAESEVVRFIEVKGRNARTGEVELTDNEYGAAERQKERYFLYRVFVDPSDPSVYEVAVLHPQHGLDGVGHAQLWGRGAKLAFDPVQDRQQMPSKLSNVPGDVGSQVVVVHGRGSFG